jgi:hypothetical protein
MAKARIALDSPGLGTLLLDESNLIWKGDFQHKKEREEVYHTHELKGDLTLTGDAFAAVKNLSDNCEAISVTVERECAGDWEEYWTGSFTKFDCKFDFDKCTVTVQPKADSPWTCVKKEWDDPVNFFVAVAGGKVINTLGVGKYEFEVCTVVDGDSDDYDIDLPCGGTKDLDSQWCQSAPSTVEPISGGFKHSTPFHRVWAIGASPGNPPALSSGWTLMTDVPGNRWWRCPDANEINLPKLDRGRLFSEIMTYLVGQLGCGLTLRSYFFGLNATHAAPPSNGAYDFALANCHKIICLQKSDVKRPHDTNAATSESFKMKLQELLADLRKMFKVYPKIVGNDLILEHISYFTSVSGLDLSDEGMKLQVDFDISVSRKTRMVWMDEECSLAFKGRSIEYNCGGDNSKEERVAYFSTDVSFIADPIRADVIADAGFVLVAAIEYDGEYAAIDQNEPFGWTSLIENLHRYNADFGSGTFGSETTAITVRKNQKQPSFSTCLECSTGFDPGDFITTPLGEGEVQEATYNIFRDSLSVQLNYE